MITYLKVKNLSLGGEIKVIRNQEQRTTRLIRRYRVKPPRKTPRITYEAHLAKLHAERSGMFIHRKELSRDSRWSFLAYGALRGVPYKRIESKLRQDTPAPDWDAIQAIAMRFGEGTKQEIAQRFERWKQEAEAK